MYLAASVPLSFRCLLSVTAHTIYIHLILQEYSAYNYAIQATRQEPGIYTGVCLEKVVWMCNRVCSLLFSLHNTPFGGLGYCEHQYRSFLLCTLSQ